MIKKQIFAIALQGILLACSNGADEPDILDKSAQEAALIVSEHVCEKIPSCAYVEISCDSGSDDESWECTAIQQMRDADFCIEKMEESVLTAYSCNELEDAQKQALIPCLTAFMERNCIERTEDELRELEKKLEEDTTDDSLNETDLLPECEPIMDLKSCDESRELGEGESDE